MGGKMNCFLIHFQFGKTLDYVPTSRKDLCSFEGKWRLKRNEKESGGWGERRKNE